MQGLGNKENLMYLLQFYMNKSELLEALVCNVHDLNVQGWVLRAGRNAAGCTDGPGGGSCSKHQKQPLKLIQVAGGRQDKGCVV